MGRYEPRQHPPFGDPMGINYCDKLNSACWFPGPNASAEYQTFLIDARRWLSRRRFLDEDDRIGDLYWLAEMETIRRFGFPTKRDERGRRSLETAALCAARYHEGWRDLNGQRRSITDARNKLNNWGAARFRPSQAEIDRLIREVPEHVREEFWAEMVAGDNPRIEPAASFYLYFNATVPDGEREANKRLMARALRCHDPDAVQEGNLPLGDDSMDWLHYQTAQTESGKHDRSLLDRDSRLPGGQRARLLLNAGHAANGLRFRTGSAELVPMVSQVRKHVSRSGRATALCVPGAVANRHSSSFEKFRTPDGRDAVEFADTRHMMDLEQLARLEQAERIQNATDALLATTDTSTVRFTLLTNSGLLFAILRGEMTRSAGARQIGCNESTLRESLGLIVRDLRGSLAV